MESAFKERREQLCQLEEFIQSSTDRLNSFLDSLGWSQDVLTNKAALDMVVCPLNPEHRMPQRSLERHLEKCTLSMEGYKPDDEFLSASEFPSSPSVTLDRSNLEEVLQSASAYSAEPIQGVAGVAGSSAAPSGSSSGSGNARRAPPRTSWRLLTDLTPTERSALHTYVVTTLRKEAGPSLGPEDLQLPYSEDSKQSRPKSKIELLAEQRDAKRRRMNHKKVHTSRKTHTEVLREVIRNQMEYLSAQDSNKTSDP